MGHYPASVPTTRAIDRIVERQLWTAEDFLQWLQPGVHADLIDGEKIHSHSPVNFRHADLFELFGSFAPGVTLNGRNWAESTVRSSRCGSAPVMCFCPTWLSSRTSRSPVWQRRTPRLRRHWLWNHLAPNTADLDVGPKFAAYEEHGTQEYWILDPPGSRAHRFYRREGELLVEFAHGDELIRAATIPGFWMKRSWLIPDGLPEVAGCLDERFCAQISDTPALFPVSQD